MKRLAFFIAVNAIVSVVVTLGVLWIWDATHRESVAALPSPTAAAEATAPSGEQPVEEGQPAEPGQETEPTAQPGAPPGLATITPTVYVVQSGDTLGSIAAQFDVSVEDLMAANGLTDPNVLDVGQTLQVPIGGVVQPPPTEAPPPTDTPAPAEGGGETPTEGAPPEASGPAQLAIRGVLNAGDAAQERVTVVNVGGDVSLAGWTLHDAQGNVFFFPALSLFEGGAVTVHTTTGTNTVTDLYWNQTVAIWEPGETATLVDPTGAEHTTFVVP